MTIFFFLLFSSTLPSLIFSCSITLSNIKKLPLPAGLSSPTSISFNPSGQGPYISCSDGRILKYNKKHNKFQPFSYTSPNRNGSLCDKNTNILDTMARCGLPLGQGFHTSTGNLFVADAYYGLTSVGPKGGKPFINMPTDGPPPNHPSINLPYALDVDVTGMVRFTDASFVASAQDVVTGVGFPDGDDSGSMYVYDPSIDQITLMCRGLYAPAGLATDLSATYVLISESENSRKRVVKYWLQGEKSDTIDVVMNLTGIPRNIQRNREGKFWIANNIINKDSSVTPQGVKIDGNGQVLETVDFSKDYDQVIETVNEHDGKLYVGGRNFTFVGVYRIHRA